jgi:ABC-type enterochelin transport system permease subunit
MIIVDMLSRTISVDEIPLSILTGIIGTIIYIGILIKKGKTINA